MTARKSPKKKPARKSPSKASRPAKTAARKASAKKKAPARKPEPAAGEREGVVYSDLRHQFRSRLLDRLL